MNVAELKEAVETLSPEGRLELAEYLRWRSKKDDPAWQIEIGRRLDRSLAGEGHSAQSVLELHNRLSAEGR